jgi:hypothetical protein
MTYSETKDVVIVLDAVAVFGKLLENVIAGVEPPVMTLIDVIVTPVGGVITIVSLAAGETAAE